MAQRNVKKQDFDYYLTNLDWDDGSPIERDIKSFTRNDVFEHNYERPGFYSIKGLVFKYNELMVEALGENAPEPGDNMSNAGWETVEFTIENENHPAFEQTLTSVQTKQTITQLSSSLSNIKRRPMQSGDIEQYMDQRYEIVEKYFSFTPIYANDSDLSSYGVPSILKDSVVARIEKRPSSNFSRLNGIQISIPIKLDIGTIDHLNYSFEMNLPNPNLPTKSRYLIREKMYPPKANNRVDWGAEYEQLRFIDGVGGSIFDSDRADLPNGGWQRVQGTMFVQPKTGVDSNGDAIPNKINAGEDNEEIIDHDIQNIIIQIQPYQAADTPQGDAEFIGIRNLSLKFPNTENIIRPVEWQRFYSNIVVNPREDYDSPLYEENNFAMIGGLSKNSSHFKTLANLLAYNLETNQYKSAVKPTYNQYDLLSMYDTFAKYDEKLYNEYLDPYVKKIHEDYAPYWNELINNVQVSGSLYNKPVITNGMFNKDFHGVFENTYITDLDVGSVKMYKSVIPMWEQLGFDSSNYDNPSLNGYWKNIIPKDFQLDDRAGIIKQDLPDPERGALTPRIPREEYVFISGSDQEWNDGYYWPVLPLINHVGIFETDVDTSLYGDESIAKITNTIDADATLTFNLNFDVDEVEELQDSSNRNTIRYSTDSLLLLDDNDRVFKDAVDITDTIEKDIRRQAF